MFDYVILVASSLGVVVNAAGLWMIGRRRKSRAFAKSMFHDLLMILMGYDLLVVICCMLQGGGGQPVQPVCEMKGSCLD